MPSLVIIGPKIKCIIKVCKIYKNKQSVIKTESYELALNAYKLSAS